MPFSKQLSSRQLSVVQAESQTQEIRRIGRHPIPIRPFDDDRRAIARQDIARRDIPPAVLRFTFEAFARLGAGAGTTFPNVLLGIVTCVIGEFLAGCAAYGEAMYMVPVPAEDDAKAANPLTSALPRACGSAASPRPKLRVIAGTAAPGVESHEPLPLSEPPEPSLPTSQQEAPWYVSISSAATVWFRSVRQARVRRGAVIELKALDDRSLRDIGLCRSDIEAAVKGEGR
ncbi:DUF1127 domain-containing protein [Bradyrhizobium sp. ARR65]|uniref:DUF1127 domain-containing protein n=1 Tax=Bradyrhizobium sp. ARR65 TaxID=1040989 RepID=UPI00046362E8|nr:DUF1127 domain-containing protein [Bradyrhizobium sp. ARR65]